MTIAAYPTMYAQTDDHGGYALKLARTGWVLDGWSRIQGRRTSYRLLLPYVHAPYGYTRATSLNAPHNETLTVGEAIAWLMRDDLNQYRDRRQTRTLRRGWIVE